MPTSRLGRVRAQLASWRAERAKFGMRHATVHRLRRLLDLGPVTEGRVELITGQIDQLTGRVGHDEVESTQRFDAAARTATETAEALEREAATTAAHRSETELFQRVWTTTAWLESTHVEEDMLVSVALPTRGMRPDGLRRAVDSVLRQAYERWELVVAVDGSDASVAEVEAQLPPDERVRVVHSPRQGVSAARNTALAEARGELVAYVDDDNLMAPLWLKAVVWAAAHHPDAAIFLGAQLVESGHERGLPDRGPALWAPTFDRYRLRRGNYVDQGAIAHRRNLPEAQYDESLTANVDWDLLLRMTERRDPVTVPVVAGHYSTRAPGRLTGSADAERSWEIVYARAREMAPLRVLAFNKMYPLVSERYIGEDLDALADQGAEIACCVYDRRSAPMPISFPVYTDLEHAVEQHHPDVALVHWTGVALEQAEKLRALGIPYAVRAHSFADEPTGIQRLLDDPWCVGIWCFPHHAIDDPRVHPLPTIFSTWQQMPPPAAERDLVLSVSAGLPKKDFPLLVDAFAALPGIERRIVVGTTYSFESIVGELVLMTQDLDDPPLVQANLDRETIFGYLARTSVFVYTVTAEAGFGMPMSIVEAMTAGACVVAPDRPEVARAFGPDIRSYTTADDIAAHVRAVFAGGPAIEAERERNRAWAIERFCDPETGKRFYAELADAVRAWTPAG